MRIEKIQGENLKILGRILKQGDAKFQKKIKSVEERRIFENQNYKMLKNALILSTIIGDIF